MPLGRATKFGSQAAQDSASHLSSSPTSETVSHVSTSPQSHLLSQTQSQAQSPSAISPSHSQPQSLPPSSSAQPVNVPRWPSGVPTSHGPSRVEHTNSRKHLSREHSTNFSSSLRRQRSNSRSTSKSSFTIDTLRPDEIRSAIAVLGSYFPREETPSSSQLSARVDRAPHLTLGMFVSLPPPMVAGPLSVSGDLRRRLIGVLSATAAPAHIMQSMYGHSQSSLARVVCIQDFGVEQGYRHQRIGSRLLSEFIRRLQVPEYGSAPHHQEYEIVSVVCPMKRRSFFEEFGFHFHSFSYESRAMDPWIEMRRHVSGHVLPSLDTSFAQEDWADQHSLLSALSSPATQGLSFNTTRADMAALSLSTSSERGLNTRPASPLPFGAMSFSPANMSPLDTTSATSNEQSISFLLHKAHIGDGAARDLGLAPPLSARPQPKRNPGKAFEAIFGEAMASKTFSETFQTALKSRIVDFKYGLNLYPLLCPNEACDCTLVARKSAEWTMRETGPLTDTVASIKGEDTSSHVDNPEVAHAPWAIAMSQAYTESTATIGPVRGFWHVPNPMGFDNVTFTRNMEWTVPSPTTPLPTSMARTSSSSNQHSRRRDSRNSMSTLRQTLRMHEAPQRESFDSAVPDMPDDCHWDVTPGEVRTIKYIMCPDCGCGPLGFSILPRGTTEESQQSVMQNNDCYVAVFRVRYYV